VNRALFQQYKQSQHSIQNLRYLKDS
jgi:hypothetical protein